MVLIFTSFLPAISLLDFLFLTGIGLSFLLGGLITIFFSYLFPRYLFIVYFSSSKCKGISDIKARYFSFSCNPPVVSESVGPAWEKRVPA